MTTRRNLLLAAGAFALPAPALAQAAWPSRSIRLVLGFAPGGVGDLTARLVAPRMSEELGQTIIIDNRPSAGSIVATEQVARAAPDGYTLLLITTTHSTAASLYRTLPYDVMRDFAPIGRMTQFDHVLLTAPNSPLRTVRDVIEAARKDPGKINVGSISVGNAQHLGAELFRRMAGVDMTVIPYRSTPDLLNATATGDVHVASEILAPTLGQIQGGRLRAMAMCSAERFQLLPDVPTVRESGLPDYVVASWNGLGAPTGTPPAVIERINRALVRAVAIPDVQRRLYELGVKPATTSAAEFGAYMRAEAEIWGRTIEAANIPKQ